MVIASLIAPLSGFDEKYIEHNRKTIGFLFTAAANASTATTTDGPPARDPEIAAGRGAAATIKTLSSMRGPDPLARDVDDSEAESFKPRARVKRIDRSRAALSRKKSSALTVDRRDRHSSRRLLRRLSVADETDPAVEEAREFERESLREDGTFLDDRLTPDTRNRLEDIYPDLQAVSDRLNSPSKRLKTAVDVKSRDRREEEQYDDANCGGSEEGNLRDCYYDNGAKSSAERSGAALEDESSYAAAAAPVKRSSSVAQARKKPKKKPKKHKSKHNVAMKHKGKEKTRHKGKPKKHAALTSARMNPLSKLTETNKCATGGAREKVKSVKSNAALANARKTAASKHTVIISTSGNSHSNNHNDVNGNKDAKVVIDLLQQLIQKVDSLHGLVTNIGNNPGNSNDNQQSSDETRPSLYQKQQKRRSSAWSRRRRNRRRARIPTGRPGRPAA
ncbi:hypothetical protein TKK_0009345 [Trichogramma kaykai]|uniref:Uncharacterized protein n=1 Tax=Trichogramma kaykai TaxID=54128 RepID=A0ABD2X240_9HYME